MSKKRGYKRGRFSGSSAVGVGVIGEFGPLWAKWKCFALTTLFEIPQVFVKVTIMKIIVVVITLSTSRMMKVTIMQIVVVITTNVSNDDKANRRGRNHHQRSRMMQCSFLYTVVWVWWEVV